MAKVLIQSKADPRKTKLVRGPEARVLVKLGRWEYPTTALDAGPPARKRRKRKPAPAPERAELEPPPPAPAEPAAEPAAPAPDTPAEPDPTA